MRFAFISTILGYPWGGADTLWTHAAEAASARGDALLLSISPMVAAHARIQALVARGAKTVIRRAPAGRLPFADRVRRKLGLLPATDNTLIAALQAFKPDAVIFSQGGTYDLVLHSALTDWLRSSRTRFRIIANWQEENPRLDAANLAFIRDTFVAADRLNFVSTRNLTVTRRHLGLPLPNAQVIQNPLRWQPADVAPWPAGPVTRLATVSRLDEGKGIQLLLQALAGCGASLPDWQLNIYGQGPYEPQLRAAAASLGGRVQFRGYVKQLRDIWAENHLMVSPAIEDGVPMTIPEAMLCQRPVLATCVGGAEDWLTHGQTGFLSPSRDDIALVTLLEGAFASRVQWEEMGLAAAASAAEHYKPNDYLQLITP